jgi:hypothetical protein
LTTNLFTEEVKKMEDIKLKEAVAAVMKDGGRRDALAELIVEYAEPGHLPAELMSLILDTRALKPGK